jgi:ferredoxin
MIAAGQGHGRRRLDLLAWPVIGRFLRWRHARAALQVPLLVVAGLLIFDGLFGPQLAPKNLATVGVWLHYRGLVVLALLAAGNLFCMACPFMLPRRFGRWLRERWLAGGRLAPALLRSKWPAVILLVLFFYSYEYFALWASPWLTAWIAVGYFVAGFAVDTVFRGATFCKRICPLGQFNFLGSLVSPLEIAVRRPGTCAACRTRDCIQTRSATRARGCELALFQPRKVGNMDCTFCLDCVHACPHDNIGLIGRLPTAELWRDPFRSGVGRFSQRRDLAALVVVLTFGAFVNALAMIRPIYDLQGWLPGFTARAPWLGLVFLIGLGVLPVTLLSAAGFVSRVLGGETGVTVWANVRRYLFALAPLAFGMWLAHYAFHFLTGALTIAPVVQSFLADLGVSGVQPRWGWGALVPADWLFPIEAFFLYLGAFGSAVAVFQIARRHIGEGSPEARRRVVGAALPWLALCLLLLAAGLWIMTQPMEMRGTFVLSSVR